MTVSPLKSSSSASAMKSVPSASADGITAPSRRLYHSAWPGPLNKVSRQHPAAIAYPHDAMPYAATRMPYAVPRIACAATTSAYAPTAMAYTATAMTYASLWLAFAHLITAHAPFGMG